MWPRDYGDVLMRKGFDNEYDFIIVGAGSAGCVLANRLSENPQWKILLLEAGGDPPIESMIPRLAFSFFKTKYDWQYYAEISDTVSQYSPKGSYWARGKVLGGSSAMNSLVYARGNEDDYNNWESLGNPSWGWKDILPYFKKSEANRNFEGYYHSKDGLLSVEFFNSSNPLSQDIIAAAEELGYKFLLDINAKKHVGFTLAQGTLKSGLRNSAASAFLISAMNRPNLHIVKHAHVTKLEIDSQGTVSGVSMKLRGQTEFKAFAKKEVILSAGAINSPQILMLSGIGPASHLQEMKIPVIQSLQVGKNLQDHPYIPLFLKMDKSTAVAVTVADLVQSYYQYLAQHAGIFANSGTVEAIGFVNSQDMFARYPDIQYYHIGFQKGQASDIIGLLQNLGYNDVVINTAASASNDGNIIILPVALLNENSRGEILLRNADPMQKPKIYPNYLREESDIQSFLRAIRLYLKFLGTEAYKRHETELFSIPIPECDAQGFNSDAYWTCYIRYMISTVFHPCGTNKMGPDSDPGSVVDYRLRVKGTTGLRVIDASIMPRIPRGNLNAPTIMIAEKGSDFIKNDLGFLI
ncbi:glucose dehydrogenase [FAD, quinone]-like [Phlebotomus argentipes]|uniref:glucose dehydrogenase [FAD, quinone]-like n=1 Tax=Phlebotomus argentipes TaxID=94469 RepID=UPI002892F144|nr:glucose dehydrogenase [FAD, quinone]-like [Phlebotomus argentipes]